MNGPSNDFMDLGKCQWCGQLRPTHRATPFCLVFETLVAITLGFLEEIGLDFAEDDFGGDGFFEADRDKGGFFEAGFLAVALEGVAGLSDSDLAFDGCAASCRWT